MLIRQKNFVKIKSIYQRNQPIVPLKLIVAKRLLELLFKSPKRPLDTLYLKEGQKEVLINDIEEFCDPDTRADYLSHGIHIKGNYALWSTWNR